MYFFYPVKHIGVEPIIYFHFFRCLSEGIIKIFFIRYFLFISFFEVIKKLLVWIHDDVERCGASQLLVDYFHAPVDFGVAFEVIDESVFHLQFGNSNRAYHGQKERAV